MEKAEITSLHGLSKQES